MPKRKKYMRLPNAFGSIRYLGKGRSMPYAVHPPCTQRDDKGIYVRPAALCYVPDWYTGFAVLTAYHAGTYQPGMEYTISKDVQGSNVDLDAFCRRVLKDVTMMTGAVPEGMTLAEVFEQFIDYKFGATATKTYSPGAEKAYRAGFKHLKPLHNHPISKITLDDLQQCVIDCDRGKGTRANIVLAAKQLYKYAVPRHLCEENPAQFLVVPEGRENVHGVPFTNEEVKIFWKNRSNPIARALVIMCYSGFRVSAYQTLEVHSDHFMGGIKTDAGKGRIVPIHPGIAELLPLPKELLQTTFRKKMYEYLDSIGMTGDPRHTPHDCRHTFSRLCESYGVRDVDRKRMLGHSLSNDITNDVYGHRSVDELMEQIRKIPNPADL